MLRYLSLKCLGLELVCFKTALYLAPSVIPDQAFLTSISLMLSIPSVTHNVATCMLHYGDCVLKVIISLGFLPNVALYVGIKVTMLKFSPENLLCLPYAFWHTPNGIYMDLFYINNFLLTSLL